MNFDFQSINEEEVNTYILRVNSYNEEELKALSKSIGIVFNNIRFLAASFKDQKVNFGLLNKFYLLAKTNQQMNFYLQKILFDALDTLNVGDCEIQQVLHCLVIFYEYPFNLTDSFDLKIFRILTEFHCNLEKACIKKYIKYIKYGKLYPQDISYRLRIIELLKEFITTNILSSYKHNVKQIINSVKVLSFLYTSGAAPVKDFYIQDLEDFIEFKNEYKRFSIYQATNDVDSMQLHEKFTFCNYPFLLTIKDKLKIVRIHFLLQMFNEYENHYVTQSFIQHLQMQSTYYEAIAANVSTYLVLNIDRQNIVQDAAMQLMNSPDVNLRLPLKVMFSNEIGMDQGGLQKEFLYLSLKELLCDNSDAIIAGEERDCNLFLSLKDSNLLWFHPEAVKESDLVKFYLLGLLVGLAFYNGILLDLPLPNVFFKKLLRNEADAEICLEDLKDGWPTLCKSFTQMRDYNQQDVEQVFGLTFEASDPLDQNCAIELIENGANINVTLENRDQFLKLYFNNLVNGRTHQQFNALKSGFDKVIEPFILKIVGEPEELISLLCGNQTKELDFYVLRANTAYDGFQADSQYIKQFWDVAQSWSLEMRCQFLFFVTASERVPVGGIGDIKLLLPKYDNENVLKERLEKAIVEGKGFGLV